MQTHFETEQSLHAYRHEVSEAAEECLHKSLYLAVRHISCDYDRGVLFLRGRVITFYQKQLAQEAVAKVSGVTRVVNDIEVVAPLG